MTKKKKKAPVLDTEYLYPPVAPGQEPILLQRLPLEERIDRAIEMNLDNLEYERARAEAALATLAAWRASAIQQHTETLGQFIDMTNQRDDAEQRARRLETKLRSLESQLSKLEMVYATAQQNADEWQKLCNGQMSRAEAAEAALAARNTPCVWTRHKDHWQDTTWTHQHGNDWIDPDGFCQYCGSPIEQVISEGYE